MRGGGEDSGINRVRVNHAVLTSDPLNCVLRNNVGIFSAVFASISDQPGSLLRVVLTPRPRLAEGLLCEHSRRQEQRQGDTVVPGTLSLKQTLLLSHFIGQKQVQDLLDSQGWEVQPFSRPIKRTQNIY